MKSAVETAVTLHDFEPAVEDFRAEVLRGLRAARKHLPCKFFYDERGSHLFDRICELDEYYLTRTELEIMRRYVADMAAALGPRCMLVEYGSGSSLKTRALLDRLEDPAGYVPIDISRSHLMTAAHVLAAAYPRLQVMPVCADYTAHFALPECSGAGRKVVYFPGSTIGNFEPQHARQFLAAARQRCGPGSGLLIGVDLKKDPALLHAAYNDAAGVTADFNLNLLYRINRELDGTFSLDHFAHYAYYEPRAGRIEMHLVSTRDQMARAAGEWFCFEEGETIFTESSYKYTLNQFERLARDSGYAVERIWTDDRRMFSVQFLTAI